MKRMEQWGLRLEPGEPRLQPATDEVRRAVNRVKEAMQNQYVARAGEHARVLRLALTEAEALAWQTEFPHLFFPALAAEKAEAALLWHRRQRALRQRHGEMALAE